MSIKCSKKAPIPYDCNSEEDSDATTSTPTKTKVSRNHGRAGRNLASASKSSRRSLAASALASPATSDISQDSSDDEDRIWDTPLGGKGRFGVVDSSDVTPLTPPSTHKRARSVKFANAESPLVRKSRSQSQSIADTAFETDIYESDGFDDDQTADEGYFSPVRRPNFRVNNPGGKIEKIQTLETFVNKPVTNFKETRKIVVKTESTSIRKCVTSDTTIHASVEYKRRSTIIHEQARKADESVAKSTTSVTVKRETSVPAPELQYSIPFENHAGFCVAWTQAGNRCSRQVGGPGLVRHSLEILAAHYNSQEYEAFIEELETFIDRSLCRRSHHDRASKILKTAREKTPTNERCRRCVLDLFHKADADAFFLWASTVSDLQGPDTRPVVIEKRIFDEESHTISSTVTTDIKSDTASSMGHSSTLVPSPTKASAVGSSRFQRWQPDATKRLGIPEALEKLIKKELTQTDCNAGFVYAYRIEGESWVHHLKIGCSNNPSLRLRTLKSKCKQKPILVEGMHFKVRNAKRVENLMHTELKEVRKSFECEACGARHREWFEVSESHVKKVFEKWRAWIEQRPYKKGEWTLKPGMETTLADICVPVPWETESRMPTGPSKPETNVKKATTSAILQLAAEAITRELWYKRLAQMKKCISENGKRCIAFTRRGPRCSCRAPGGASKVEGHLHAWERLLGEERYIELPTLVKKFFKSAVCGNQKGAKGSLLEQLDTLEKLATGSDAFTYSFAAAKFLYTDSVLWPRPLFQTSTRSRRVPVAIGRTEPKRVAGRKDTLTSGCSAGVPEYEEKNLDVKSFQDELQIIPKWKTIADSDTIIPELKDGFVYIFWVKRRDRDLSIEYSGLKKTNGAAERG